MFHENIILCKVINKYILNPLEAGNFKIFSSMVDNLKYANNRGAQILKGIMYVETHRQCYLLNSIEIIYNFIQSLCGQLSVLLIFSFV